VEDAMNLIRNRSSAQKTKRRFPQKHTLATIYGLSVNMCKTVDDIIHEQYPQFIQEIDEISQLFIQYVNYKRQHHLMDYDDLLVYLLMLLESKPHIASQLQKDHQFIMIDEYQDTNSLQHRIVKALAGSTANVMAVGDDAQSIYSFRGANHANILEFPSLFKDCALYAIEQNYRSVQPILDCANHVLQAASFGYKKELFSSLLSEEKPMIISTRNEQEQSAFIVQQILELREEGISLNAMAALVRSGYMSFDLEIELAKAQIPFRKFGGFKFIETAHVKDMLAFFRIANNPTDILAWHRLLLLLEGVGPGTASIITDEISSGKLSLMDDTGWQEIKRGKDEILRLLALLRKMQDPALSINEKIFLAGEFYRPILRKKHDDSAKRWKDIETFSAIAERYSDIATMLSEMALEPPTESVEAGEEFNEDEYFTISTIHSAKGLEWNTVFIPWVLDGKFPPNKALIDEEHIEEERRLMYVAITRAKEHLYLLYPIDIFDRESGMVLGSPSRFLDSVHEPIAGRFALLPEGDS
jgi:DNA helicase-2/ATP-dependent DNA helicase PcrA